MAVDLRLESGDVALLVDLYELTMAASYFALGFNQPATFSLSIRRLPPRRGFLVAAGVERLLEVITELRFDQAAIAYLDSLKLFGAEFLAMLGEWRFTGDIRALPEGTILFADEPLLEVTAPLIEAQMLETLAINQVGFATLAASKAVRSTIAAGGQRIFDFGMRRSQGADASLIAARSSYLAGFAGTSNVLAGRRYGIPLCGTMAHSYVMAHERERTAFEHFVAVFPQESTLLVDTYDTLRGVENAAQVALELKRAGHALQAVRLDSGDLRALAVDARRILDRHGLRDVAIFASGNLDEYRIEELVRAGAPIDAFGVGTEMVVGGDVPALDIAYKLSEYAGVPRIKTSTAKVNLPGRKQVMRALDTNRQMTGDRIALAGESVADVATEFQPTPAQVVPLLQQRMKAGRLTASPPTLEESRAQLCDGLESLPPRLKDLLEPGSYSVGLTAALMALFATEQARPRD